MQLIDWGLLPRAALGVLALVCGNGFIVGINQVRHRSALLPVFMVRAVNSRMSG